jgi:cyclic pyranopterin phosphate synthase
VRKVRLTGGEPLCRADLEDIVARVSGTPGIEETTLTTNGIGLRERADGLRRAGLDRVNISCDTLCPERFRAISGVDAHAQLMQGIERARDVFPALKLNTVLLRGRNEDEVESLVRFAAERDLHIRFIELYASRCADVAGQCVPADEVLERLVRAFGAVERTASAPLSVEETYTVPGAGGARVGIIRSASRPPCGQCDKLRFVASGELRPCLFSETGFDVTELLATGDTERLRAAIRAVYASKDRSGPACPPIVPGPIACVGG